MLGEQPEVVGCRLLEIDLGCGSELVAVVAVDDWCSGAVLRQRCARALEGVAPPAVVVVSAEAAGPLDAAAAAAIARGAPVVARHDPPADAHEASVATIVATLLGCDAPSMTDHFFDLGGDSLRLLELVNAVEDDLGAVLDPEDVLGCANLREMADLVRGAAGVDVAAAAG